MRKSVQLSFATGPAPIRVHIAGFLLVALILATVAIWSGINAWNLDKNGIRTIAKVVDVERSSEASAPVFEFTDSLDRYYTVRAGASTDDYPVGSSIPVIYPEGRPLKARVDDRIGLYLLTMITGLMSSAFLLAAGVLVRLRAKFQAKVAARLGKLRISLRGPSGRTTHKEYSSVPVLTWISRIFGAGAVILVGAAIWTGWQSYESASSGVKADGVVVELNRIGGSHRVHVQFEDSQGSLYRAALPDRSNDYLVGDWIPLIYPAGSPQGVQLRSSSMFLSRPGYFALLAFIFTLVTTATRIQLAEIEKARREPG